MTQDVAYLLGGKIWEKMGSLACELFLKKLLVEFYSVKMYGCSKLFMAHFNRTKGCLCCNLDSQGFQEDETD